MKQMDKFNTTTKLVEGIINDVQNRVHDLVQNYFEEMGIADHSIAHSLRIPVRDDNLQEELENWTEEDIEELANDFGLQDDISWECDTCGDCLDNEDDDCSCEEEED